MKKFYNFRHITSKSLPVIYFLAIAIYWFFDGFLAVNSFNYLAFFLITLLVIHFVSRNKVLGLTLGLIAFVLSAIMFLGVMAEYNEFIKITEGANRLIFYGNIISFGGLLMSVLMIVTNFKNLKQLD